MDEEHDSRARRRPRSRSLARSLARCTAASLFFERPIPTHTRECCTPTPEPRPALFDSSIASSPSPPTSCDRHKTPNAKRPARRRAGRGASAARRRGGLAASLCSKPPLHTHCFLESRHNANAPSHQSRIQPSLCPLAFLVFHCARTDETTLGNNHSLSTLRPEPPHFVPQPPNPPETRASQASSIHLASSSRAPDRPRDLRARAGGTKRRRPRRGPALRAHARARGTRKDQ